MTVRRSPLHLRLVKSSHEANGRFVPPLAGEQLALFEERGREFTLAVLQLDGIHEGQFIQWIRGLRPRLIVDTRLSPRFDLGALNRRTAFALFQEADAMYVDLASELASDQTAIGDEELSKAVRSLQSLGQKLVGPLLFLTDGRVKGDALFGVVSRDLSTSAGSHWRYLTLHTPPQQAQSI